MKNLADGTPTQLWLDPGEHPDFGDPLVLEREIRCVQLPGNRVLSECRRLRTSAPNSGWWPVLAGGVEQAGYLKHFCFFEGQPLRPLKETLAESDSMDGLNWIRHRQERWLNYCNQEARLRQSFERLQATASDWPEHEAAGSDCLLEERNVENWTRGGPAIVLLIPCREPWEVFCYLNFGGWNDCPLPAEHSAIWRHWHRRWGVTILGAGESTLSGIALNYPADRSAAIQLAWEQFYYNNDALTLDGAFLAETIPQLAMHRISLPIWSFWWD